MEETNGDNYEIPEVSTQSQNATNYFRLVQLTMVEGTNVVRKTILSRIPQRKTLHTILAERKSEFNQRGSGFKRRQIDVLYPASGNVDLAKIDMTLWFALARKFRILPKAYLEDLRTEGDGNISNNGPLLGTQVEWCQDLATIHAVRNNLFHLVKPEMKTEIFEDQWNRLTEALYRLDPGLDQNVIERYSSAELNPKVLNELRAMITEQCLHERCDDLADEVRKRSRITQLILFVDALVLILILVAVLAFVFLYKQTRTCDKSLQYRVVGKDGALYFMPRSGWGAVPPSQRIEPLRLPTPILLYSHTAEISECAVTDECCNQVKNIQSLHMYKKVDPYEDIGYHYLLDSKGIVYEGRSIKEIPSAVYHWNRNITTVAFLGNFMYQTPTAEALAAFDLLIAYFKYNNYIMQNYTILAMCECINSLSPGRTLYEEVNRSNLPHISGHVGHRKEGYCSFNGV